MKLVSSCILCLVTFYTYALNLNDFAPNIINSNNNVVESSIVRPLVGLNVVESSTRQVVLKNTESSMSCNRAQNPFCMEQPSNAISSQNSKSVIGNAQPVVTANHGANDQYFNRDGTDFDQNAINNFNITNSNQTAMQAYSSQLNNVNLEDRLKQNLAIPLSTGSNSAVSVGTNKVQFNVSY